MRSNWVLYIVTLIIIVFLVEGIIDGVRNSQIRERQYSVYLSNQPIDSNWVAPSLFIDHETTGNERRMVMYGKDLIAHTSKYFGPLGSISRATNGMNCQNCHLDAGTRPWGNNFGAVYSLYPQFRGRSNTIQTIYGRVNDCFHRSLNGKAIDDTSYEMQSLYAYIKWLGKNVPKGIKPVGAGLPILPIIDRAANVIKGKAVYFNLCKTCHGDNGQGSINQTGNEYIYPPLWGEHSYNDGAGLYRLSSFASYVENNMPYNIASHQIPKLTIEDSWDVAAFVNSQPRPHIDQSKDWPDVSKKVFDAPFGPYPDSFSQQQHKYGPYTEIINNLKSKQLKK